MKRMSYGIAMIVLLFILSACSQTIALEQKAITVENTKIVIATDLHYLSPELTDNGSFFTELIENSDGKVMAYSEELLEAFVTQVIAEKPEILILSGDITFNGEKQSHKDLARKLSRVQDSGIQVLVLPGNHDINNAASVNFQEDAYLTTANINERAFKEMYREFGYEIALSYDSSSLSYVYEVSPNLRILMLDTNSHDNRNSVSKETNAWMETNLEKAYEENARVIAVSHQNLLPHNETITKGFVIEDNQKLVDMYSRYHVLANFSGHIHMQHIQKDAKTDFADIVTASLATSPNQYGVIEIKDNTLRYQTESVAVSDWAKENHREDLNLLNFAAYSDAFFWESSYQKAKAMVGNHPESEGLARFFADVNLEYFKGTNDFRDQDGLFDVWIDKSERFGPYMESIRKELGNDYNTYEMNVNKNQ